MAIKLSQSLKQSQGLVMTPQLQQAIKLLTLTHMEVTDLIASEMVENPMLEEAGGDREGADYSQEAMEGQGQEAMAENFEERPILSNENDSFDWKNYIESTSSSESPTGPSVRKDPEDQMDYENFAMAQQGLADHLLWQVRMEELSANELSFAEFIIHNINDDGHLDDSLEGLLSQSSLSGPQAMGVVQLVQRLDPIGCATESVQDSLLAQAKMAKEHSPLLESMIRGHFRDLRNKDYEKIAQACGVGVEQVKRAEGVLQQFHPNPGRLITGQETHYIVPDIYVVKVGAEYIVQVNDDGIPRLRISKLYQNMLKQTGDQYEKAQEFVQEKLRSALWLIKSIQNRQRTIEKVAKAIVGRQQEFFRIGPKALKPMILKDIANEIGMHESTVSRVTNNKYMHTPIGIFELKYFFSTGIGGKGGGHDVTSESLRLKIKAIIEREDPKRPFSDQKISSLLSQEGLTVARRTVAKYREAMDFLPSSKRKAK